MIRRMDAPADQFVRRAKLLRVIDGDTLRLEIDLGFGASIVHDVRLSGIDTPEPRSDERLAGQWVTKQVVEWIGERTELLIHSKVFELGKFGRCLCEVWVDGECLNHWLLDRNLAWPTNSVGAIEGLRKVERLVGIPVEIRQEVGRLML